MKDVTAAPTSDGADWTLSARLLRLLSRPPLAADFAGGTVTHVGDRALEFIDRTVPDFRAMIAGRTVLDYGCGRGDQALAMKAAGAASVVGYDRYPKWDKTKVTEGVRFTSVVPRQQFDLVLSCSAFEHFENPEAELATMRSLTRGRLVITWAEPWYCHSGSHMNFFTRVPW